MKLSKCFIVVAVLLLLVAPYARAEFMVKPVRGTLLVSEGMLYNSNPGYADVGAREHDWANQMSAGLSLEVPFGQIHKYTLNSNTTWIKYFTNHKFNQVNNNLTHSVDFTFNRWALNIHQNFDASSVPDTNEMPIVSKELLRKRINAPGFAVRGDLGKLKLSGGFDYQDYDTNDEYKILQRKTYTPYLEGAMQITPLLDGFMRYTYTRTIRAENVLNNSHGNDVKVGLRGNLTPYLTGEVGIGYDWTDFSQSGTTGDQSNYHGLVYSGGLTNRLSKHTTQKISFSLEPEQGYSDANYYKCWTTEYMLSHTLNTKVDVNASVGYILSNESGHAYDMEKSNIWQFGTGFNYHLAKNSDLVVGYNFSDKSSNRPGKNYKQHALSTSVNYRF
ncbi:MAG: outer membrane beta-barrel protein [Candidatus Omnitrophota bacterium]